MAAPRKSADLTANASVACCEKAGVVRSLINNEVINSVQYNKSKQYPVITLGLVCPLQIATGFRCVCTRLLPSLTMYNVIAIVAGKVFEKIMQLTDTVQNKCIEIA